jgi:hypothetical protein
VRHQKPGAGEKATMTTNAEAKHGFLEVTVVEVYVAEEPLRLLHPAKMLLRVGDVQFVGAHGEQTEIGLGNGIGLGYRVYYVEESYEDVVERMTHAGAQLIKTKNDTTMLEVEE